jgi:acyl carrier protein
MKDERLKKERNLIAMKKSEIRAKILESLMDIDDTVDYEHETALVTDRILDSFAIISLVGDLEDAFGVEITTPQMVPENFDSLDGMTAMVERLMQ